MVRAVLRGWRSLNDLTHRYLAGLSDRQRARLAEINRPGLAALKHHLNSGWAVAFLEQGHQRLCIRSGMA
jgi:hypothetical protein